MPGLQLVIIKALLPFFLHNSPMPAFDKSAMKDQFNAAGTPADLPSYDPGMTGQLVQTSFQQVIRSAAKEADLVMIGDTNHHDPDIRGSAMTRDSMIAMAESGVSHLFVEVDQKLQPLADKLIQDKDNPAARAEFGRAFNKDYGDASGNERGEYTRQLAETILNGEKLGIRVHFSNPGNGWKEYDDADGYAATNPDDSQGIEDRYKLAREARFDDRQLAAFINEKSQGEKSAMIYGSSHGSRFGDFENFYNGNAVKVDIYNNAGQYRQKMDIDKETAKTGMKFNEDKPELVYFKESQTAAGTYNSSPQMMQDLRDHGRVISPGGASEGPEQPSPRQQPSQNQKQSLGL